MSAHSRCVSLSIALLLVTQARTSTAQSELSARDQAIIRAVLFVRGTASEELRTMPADAILIDATRIVERPAQAANMTTLANQMRARAVPGLDPKCAHAGDGLSPNRALWARAECATASSPYYLEPADVEINGSTAAVTVQVFKRASRQPAPGTSKSVRMDYIGYTIELTQTADGWANPRLLRISET
jgi:hypothetical protein